MADRGQFARPMTKTSRLSIRAERRLSTTLSPRTKAGRGGTVENYGGSSSESGDSVSCFFTRSSRWREGTSGTAGFAARRVCYRPLPRLPGAGTIFGRNLALRHPKRLHWVPNVVLDDQPWFSTRRFGKPRYRS